jgi:hypothetical protein
MVSNKTGNLHNPAYDTPDKPISWWSWRPGFKPVNALLIGSLASLPGLLIATAGLFTLVAPLLDHTLESYITGGSFLLLLGIAGLVYPITLLRWGLRDFLIERYARDNLYQGEAKVVATRAVIGTTSRSHPGVMRVTPRPWYGIALLPINGNHDYKKYQTLTFSVSEERYQSMREGMLVHIMYSPHLHYVYTLTGLSNEINA